MNFTKKKVITKYMKTFIILISFFSILQAASCRNAEVEVDGSEQDSIQWAKVPFADPFILLYNGTYYAYGTHAADGIEVLVSTDLYHWERPKDVQNGLALKKSDVWGDQGFWAPEVYHVDGTFYMYYTANEHICVATSKSPLGPFKQETQQPMLDGEKSIDNSLFIDDDDEPYLIFDRFNDGLNIWIARLNDNLQEIEKESLHPCIHVSQEWETVWPRVNEGSFVIKHEGIYYMVYSANSYESPFYGIGFATATNLFGTWTKYEGNPILQKPGNLNGVGHCALFRDKDNILRIVFHAHNSQTNIHPRHMYIGTVKFQEQEGVDVMTVDPDFITPVWHHD